MHPSHRLAATLALAALIGIAARPATAADGTIDLSWNACSPIVRNISTTEPGQYSIYASVHGIDQPHQGYEVALVYGDAQELAPDAWRFDPTGCQGSTRVTIQGGLAPATVAKACPAFTGLLSYASVEDVRMFPPTDPAWGFGIPETNMRAELFLGYPPGVTSVDPNQRYFLARFLFDHTYSVTGATEPGVNCGGFEQEMHFRLLRGNYVDTGTGERHEFARDLALGSWSLGFNNTTPARATTWGSLKNQYR
jgi:hypothetical protein